MVGHGGIQADMVLELKVLHLKGKRKSTETLGGILSIGNLKIHPNCDKSSNKATPPSNATPYELMGANYIQITTLSVLECTG